MYKELCKAIVPQLSASLHKGQAGRIAIVGGCQEFTGAPYFAGISALRLGADLIYIMCTPSAGTPIKSYCPDLMVLPILSRDSANQFNQWADRLHGIVFGPGLGRDEETLAVASEWIQVAKQRNIPIVIDADGLHIVTENPGIIRGYADAILTPNVIEFDRLYYSLTGKYAQKPVSQKNMISVANKLKCTVVCKGAADLICTNDSVVECSTEGSNRRCGGQGDLLSGALGLFSFWARSVSEVDKLKDVPYQSVAAFAACSLVKRANYLAFEKNKRSMITSDMADALPKAFVDIFDVE